MGFRLRSCKLICLKLISIFIRHSDVYLHNDRRETTKSLCLDSQPSLSVCIAYLYWLETFFFHFILYICSTFPLHYLHKLSTFWRLVFLYQISITIYSEVINLSLSEKAYLGYQNALLTFQLMVVMVLHTNTSIRKVLRSTDTGYGIRIRYEYADT